MTMTKLKSLRSKNHLPLSVVCSKMRIRQALLKRWESGSRDCPIERVRLLASIYGVHPSDLFPDVPRLNLFSGLYVYLRSMF